jgi:hypothetical protein
VIPALPRGALAGAILLYVFSAAAQASPVNTAVASQRISIQVKRTGGTAKLLPKGLQAKVVAKQIEWQYDPETTVSVPYVQLQLIGLPNPNPFNILIEHSQPIATNKQAPVISLPILKKRNNIHLTIVDPEGHLEQWLISMNLNLQETAIYVDESCHDYVFKIRELRRTSEAGLIYLGCLAGSGPGEMSLELFWSDLDRIEYRGSTTKGGASVVTLPLDSRKNTSAEVKGYVATGGNDVFEVTYEPYVPPPFEVWAGLAFFRNTFAQSNFPAKYSQIGTAFLGQFWYRPEDIRLNFMLRGFGSLLSINQTLDPDQGYKESVSTFFLDAELRYAVLDTASGWRLDPLIGGWAFFQTVDSRNFGIQRILDPMLGFVLQKKFAKRNSLGLTFRYVPLQSFFNPLQFSLPQSYFEFELTFVHGFKRAHRWFSTVYFGTLNYQPEGFASDTGTYLVVGGGFGW